MPVVGRPTPGQIFGVKPNEELGCTIENEFVQDSNGKHHIKLLAGSISFLRVIASAGDWTDEGEQLAKMSFEEMFDRKRNYDSWLSS